ncbi:hypothetical protein [Nocardia sp. NPDC050412]|uniref:hypothetical protein n=1 Tax=unclassified Nocardia TaxID=2637762 RepID=UPI0037968C68
MTDNDRAELAAFLRAQRSRLRPTDVGMLPDLEPGRRRTPGLRREEVAELAGVRCRLHTPSVQLGKRATHKGSR